MKDRLKRVMPSWLVRRLLYLNRFRWITKYKLLRKYRRRIRDNPAANLHFVLWDPEVESFSYELANKDELADFVAELLGAPREEIAGYIAEVDDDPELNERLRRHTRWRIDVKTPLPIGNRLLWYALARALKPKFIVETGIYQGLGSLTLLRALERNAAEGDPGELLSIDSDPLAGVVVPDRVAGRWRKVIGMTSDVLMNLVAGREIDMFIQDTPHTYENASFEYGVATSHAGERLILIDGGGATTTALADACAGRDSSIGLFTEVPTYHPSRPTGTQVAVIDRARAADPPEAIRGPASRGSGG